MEYRILTDTHFGHRKMEKLCGRPSDFERRIIENARRIIRPEDILIHLGDLYLYDSLPWVKLLMAIPMRAAWLIRGNHDTRSISAYMRMGFSCVCDRMDLHVYGNLVSLSHTPLCENRGDGWVNVHGHLHGTRHHPDMSEFPGRRICVAIEETDYEPVTLSKLLSEKGT